MQSELYSWCSRSSRHIKLNTFALKVKAEMFGSQSTVAPSEHVSVVDYVAAYVGGKREQNNNPDVMASV